MPKLKPVNDTTYEVELRGGDKVEIGDRKAADFKPHLKLNRWGGECFIKVGFPTTKKIKPVIEGDKVKFKDKDLEAHFYPLEPRTVIAKDKDGRDIPFTQNELGGFEFEVILKKKPKTNQIILNIETQGLKFYYQRALTQEEIDSGCTCPDNVPGSYAVYHATKKDHIIGKTNYMCGKAFHIYRPKITDAEGNWVWGELSLDEKAGTLIITIPQGFLDSAVYPVIVDPNFGYETIGTAGTENLWDYIYGSLFTLSGAASATSLTMAIYPPGALQTVNGAIYRHGTLALVGSATERSDLTWFEAKWWEFTIDPAVDLSADDYVLVGWGDSAGAGSTNLCYDAGDTDQGHYQNIDYSDASGVFPDPLVPTHDNNKYSIYCTYEEEAGEDYVKSAAITIGDAMSAARVLGASRTASISTGDAVSASRLFGSARTSPIPTGIVVTAIRVYGVTKTAIISIGDIVTAAKSWGVARTAAISIGTAVTAARTATWDRTAAIPTGIVMSAAKFRGWVRTAALTIGDAITASRTWGAARTAAIPEGIVITASRLGVIARTSTISIGDAVTASRLAAWKRSASIAQGIAVTATRIYGRFRSAALTIGNSVTATRVGGWARTANLSIGTAITATKLGAWDITAEITIGVAVSSARVLSAARTAALTIGTAITASRAVVWGRTVSITIGDAITASRLFSKEVSVALTIGVAVTAARVWGVARTAALTIGTVITAKWWARAIYLSLKVRSVALTLQERSLALTTKVRSLVLSLIGKEP